MKSLKVIFLTLLIGILYVSCSSQKNRAFDKSYYNKSENKWLSAVSALGLDTTNLKNHVLLVMHDTECNPCYKELAWWNKYGKKGKKSEIDISLIIIEKYEGVYQTLLNERKVSIPSYRDSSALLVKRELIPTTPIKFYFNDKGKVSIIDHMGAHGDVSGFIEQIKRQNDI